MNTKYKKYIQARWSKSENDNIIYKHWVQGADGHYLYSVVKGLIARGYDPKSIKIFAGVKGTDK